MSHFFEILWELLWDYLFEWFFGNTGRLVIKALTFGRVDLDIDCCFDCFLAVGMGLIFWIAVLFGVLYWQYPQLLPG